MPTPRRLGLAALLVVSLLTMAIGFAHKSVCIRGDFDRLRYRAYCYTDIVPLYREERLSQGAIPYIEAPNEYPVGTGLVMWIGSWFGHGEGEFFLVSAALLFAFGLVTTRLLEREVGDRALFFAAAPTLALYAFLNWDLVPVALSTAGTVAFLRRRDVRAGTLFGLAAAAKLYPALPAAAAAADLAGEGRRRGLVRFVGGAAVAFLLLNVPIAIVSFDRWSEVFRFSAERGPSPGTLWYAACRGLTGTPDCGAVGFLNASSVAAFLAVVAVVWRRRRRMEPTFPRWTLGLVMLVGFLLTSKVYSPQYSLWLLPWFALVIPNVRLFLAFEATDLAVFFAELSHLGAGPNGATARVLGIAVLARAIVLCGVLAAFARGRTVQPVPRQVRTSTSPSSSS